MIKVIFRGLGPTGNVIYDKKRIENGAIVEMDKDTAQAYINVGLAYEVVDDKTAKEMQDHVIKTNKKRKEITEKGGKSNG